MRYLYSLVLLSLFSIPLKAQTPAPQPAAGPGGTSYLHGSYTFTKFGTDIYDCYWIAEPDNPRPDSAEVVVFWHGTTTITDVDQIPGGTGTFMEHLVRNGYTVIFPLYQDGNTTLPFQQQLENGGAVLNMALDVLSTDASRVKPKKFSNGKIKLGAVGISRGGGMTMNVASYHQTLGLPSFDALCPIVPSAGPTMQGIDPSTKIVLINSDDNELNYTGSYQLWDSLYHIPCSNKHFIEVNSDSLGSPALTADHSFAGTGFNTSDPTIYNALDYYGTMKWATALFNCTFKNQDCEYCLGPDPIITYMGLWSDGTPIQEATIVDNCDFSSVSSIEIDNISIFPNPCENFLFINLPQWEGSFFAQVFEPAGRLILSSNLSTIDLHELEAGTYILKVSAGKDYFCSKFIKK